MEALKRSINRKTRRSRRCIYISVAAVFLGIIAIVTPVALVFSRFDHSRGISSTVLVPLYVYPNPGAWKPLYDVLAAHPTLNFTLIINPEDGPGSSMYPSEEYISSIHKLNSHANVKTLGYVRTSYATRNITYVLQDVAIYSGWYTVNTTSIAIDGIFFDEMPSEYSTANFEYMKTINHSAKSASGLQADRMVVHNPGTIPDTRFVDPNTDVTVVFEGSYSEYLAQMAELASLAGDRSQYSYLLHSVPINKDLRKYVGSMSQHAQFLFLTSLTEDYYESFGLHWDEVMDVIPT